MHSLIKTMISSDDRHL